MTIKYTHIIDAFGIVKYDPNIIKTIIIWSKIFRYKIITIGYNYIKIGFITIAI